MNLLVRTEAGRVRPAGELRARGVEGGGGSASDAVSAAFLSAHQESGRTGSRALKPAIAYAVEESFQQIQAVADGPVSTLPLNTGTGFVCRFQRMPRETDSTQSLQVTRCRRNGGSMAWKSPTSLAADGHRYASRLGCEITFIFAVLVC